MREMGFPEPEDWARWFTYMHARRWGVEEFVPGKVPGVESYPTLDPWLHVAQPNPGDLVLERNPYYYKIDPEGNQLPYIDRLARTCVSDIQMKNLKIISGETDLQFQWMRLSDFPLLKRNEGAGDYHAVIMRTDQEFRLIYPFNYHTKDPVWNRIIGDVRFRRALSLAFNRQEMNEVLWLGAGRPSQLAPPRDSRWYDPSFAGSYAGYDLERAHRLLDEMGLGWDEERRFRLRPDGERLTLILHYPSEQTEWGNGAEMAQEYWSALGIDVIVKSSGLLDQLREANGGVLLPGEGQPQGPCGDPRHRRARHPRRGNPRGRRRPAGALAGPARAPRPLPDGERPGVEGSDLRDPGRRRMGRRPPRPYRRPGGGLPERGRLGAPGRDLRGLDPGERRR